MANTTDLVGIKWAWFVNQSMTTKILSWQQTHYEVQGFPLVIGIFTPPMVVEIPRS